MRLKRIRRARWKRHEMRSTRRAEERETENRGQWKSMRNPESSLREDRSSDEINDGEACASPFHLLSARGDFFSLAFFEIHARRNHRRMDPTEMMTVSVSRGPCRFSFRGNSRSLQTFRPFGRDRIGLRDPRCLLTASCALLPGRRRQQRGLIPQKKIEIEFPGTCRSGDRGAALAAQGGRLVQRCHAGRERGRENCPHQPVHDQRMHKRLRQTKR